MPQSHPVVMAAAFLLTLIVILAMVASILRDRRNLDAALAKIAPARVDGDGARG